MTGAERVRSEAVAAWKSFLRRRTAVFFTFGFPLVLVAIFGVAIRAGPSGGGLFDRPTAYYVPGYLAVVVLFTPLSRLGNTIARYRDRRRFEKLATTPLRRREWLFAHVLVNVAVVLAASGLVLAVLLLGGDSAFHVSLVLVPFVVVGVVVFAGIGVIVGRLSGSQDGVVAASNAVALPLLFLSETFVPATTLPRWLQVGVELSPLTYFARGVRASTVAGEVALFDLGVLTVLAVAVFALAAIAIPVGQ